MTIHLRMNGVLKDHFGVERAELHLTNGATLKDLLAAVGERWGGTLPPYLWDGASRCFRGPVVLMIDNTPVSIAQKPLLHDGQEIACVQGARGGIRS